MYTQSCEHEKNSTRWKWEDEGWEVSQVDDLHGVFDDASMVVTKEEHCRHHNSNHLTRTLLNTAPS
jgi:hypothetical protein